MSVLFLIGEFSLRYIITSGNSTCFPGEGPLYTQALCLEKVGLGLQSSSWVFHSGLQVCFILTPSLIFQRWMLDPSRLNKTRF